MQNNAAPDLTKQAPRSPRTRVGGFAILARTTDKARAKLNGDIGEYHYDCPLDNQLFEFADVTGDDFLEQVTAGASDDELAEWVSNHGARKSLEEAAAWSDKAEKLSLHGDAETGEYFDNECQRLGLDAEKVTLFDMLEADDKASFN